MIDLAPVISDVIRVESRLVAEWLTGDAEVFSPEVCREGLQELLRLKDDDCWYDVPSMGVHYAAWHHVQRSAGLVAPMAHLLEPFAGEPVVRVVDLGVGTGASLAAIAALQRAADVPLPERVTVAGLDSSQVMLNTLTSLQERRLAPRPDGWTRMGSWLSPETRLEREYEGPSVLLASYLFDNTDRDPARAEVLARGLVRLAGRFGANRVAVVGGSSKRSAVEHAIRAMDRPSEEEVNLVLSDGPRRSLPDRVERVSMAELGAARRAWCASSDDPQAEALLRRDPPCHDRDTLVWMLEYSTARLGFEDREDAPWPRNILDPVQLEAATVDLNRPTYVCGSAGSGKSLTLIEHVAGLVENVPRGRVLVTTFNKTLADMLAGDLQRRLGDGVVPHMKGYGHQRLQYGDAVIEVLNRDLIATRIYDMGFERVRRDPDFRAIEEAIQGAQRSGELPAGSLSRWKALLRDHGRGAPESELEAFIYGLRCESMEQYLEVERRGAGTQFGQQQRRLIWWALEWQRAHRGQLWGHRRQALHRLALADDPPTTYDAIVVDEAQDFSAADFDVLLRLTPHPSRLTIFADPNQAVHLGGSWQRPTVSDHDATTVPFAPTRVLRASYRLPWLVAKALEPLTRDVDPETALVPERAALPGPRPIVIDGDADPAELAAILTTINDAHRFRPLDPEANEYRGLAISGSRSRKFAEAVAGLDVGTMHVSARQHKGREFDAVLIDTAEPVVSEDVHRCELFTLLTRSTRLLILAVSPRAPEQTRSALRLLDERYLRFHDAASRRSWNAVSGSS